MTTMHQWDGASPETSSYASTLPVEWTHLDELAYIWGNFGHVATIATAFQMVSVALSALALETNACQSYAETMRERQSADWSPRSQALLITAITDLKEAHQKWTQVDHWLARFTLIREEVSIELAIDLVLQVDTRLKHLFRLFLRLLKEAGTWGNELVHDLVSQHLSTNVDWEGV